MQSIDPIKSVRPHSPPHPRQQGETTYAQSVVRQNNQTASSTPQTGARFTKLPPQKRVRRVPWDVIVPALASPLLVPAAMFGVGGTVAVALFCIAALILRLPSRVSFVLALMALLGMVVLQQMAQVKLAQALAGYIYIFLVVGGLRLFFEVRRDTKLWFKKH